MNIAIKLVGFAAIIFWSLFSSAQVQTGLPNMGGLPEGEPSVPNATVCLTKETDGSVTFFSKVGNAQGEAETLVDAQVSGGSEGQYGVTYTISGANNAATIFYNNDDLAQASPVEVLVFLEGSVNNYSVVQALTTAEAAKAVGEAIEGGTNCYSAQFVNVEEEN